MSDAVAEDHHGDYHHGDQDISAQAASWKAFMTMAKWGSLAVAVLILTFTLAFCTQAGLGSGLAAGFVVLVLGIFFLRSKPASGH